ncbi:hypothetical protein CTheo_5034 [Ceratobasidium theobromae]|uniref:Uncharacterized protein n=1 Tax=Ceratobasidium theobromae TaxID=1582974 RepID=A0A5N5QJR7_9AGAM|nr:hypothetical protein CTheo_5034 [Ceratobasidium theobromae]
MAEAKFFPDPVRGKLTIDGDSVRLDSVEALPPFIGKVVEAGLEILPIVILGTVRYDKNSPPAGSGVARFTIQEDKRLLIVFFPKDVEIPNAVFQSDNAYGDNPPIKQAEGEWTVDLN